MKPEELELRRRVAAAERARAYIDDPLLVGAFEALEARMLLGWRKTEPTDTAGREQFWHQIQSLGMVRDQLIRVLEDGAIAQDALDNLRAGISNP